MFLAVFTVNALLWRASLAVVGVFGLIGVYSREFPAKFAAASTRDRLVSILLLAVPAAVTIVLGLLGG
jgi:hypothetical protein